MEKKDNLEIHIPKGMYCYDDEKMCPFWSMNPEFPHQENGYCHYLKEGDWEEEGTRFLFDQVKECGINEELEFD